jgi:8-oxo-dGTP diphosphatase
MIYYAHCYGSAKYSGEFMPVSEQGISSDRYQVIPRVLIFIFDGDKVLLIKGSPNKRIWANKYNGIGGHVENGENILHAAERELYEESGLSEIPLNLCGTIAVNTSSPTGILLFVFQGNYNGQAITESKEGKLEWVTIAEIDALSLVEDIPNILPKVMQFVKNGDLFWGYSHYDENEKLIIQFQP